MSQYTFNMYVGVYIGLTPVRSSVRSSVRPSVRPSGYRYMVCPAISSYSFGATALIFCRMFIHIKYIFDILVVGETKSPSATSALQYFSTLDS
jgi:hypothetical protein